MRRRLPVIALGIVAVMLFSGCFVLRGFRFSSHKIVRGGGKVVALLSMYPHGSAGEADQTDRVFVIVEFPDDTGTGPQDTNWRVVRPRVFDVNENFGNRRTLIRDNVLRNYVLANACDEIVGSSARVVLFRTQGNVDDNDRIAKEALTKLGLKANSDTAIDLEDELNFFTGRWDDDGDGVPDGDDDVECTGAFATTLPVRTG